MLTARLTPALSIPPERPALVHTRRRMLWLLCIAVALERLGSTLVLSLLVLYLNEVRGMSQGTACEWLGWLLFGSYFLSIFGGWLCDRSARPRWVAAAGTLAIGAGALGFLSRQPAVLLTAIGLFALGSGLFKPAIPALLSGLYPASAERASAFSHYYAGANVGALAGPLLAESLSGRGQDWSSAFSFAAACLLLSGMLIWRLRSAADWHQKSNLRSSPSFFSSDYRIVLLPLVTAIPLWVLLAQPGGSLMFLARDHTGPLLFLHQQPLFVPPGAYLSIHAALVVALTPVLSYGFGRLRLRGCEPSESARFAMGLFIAAASCAWLLIAGLLAGDQNRVHPLWLLGFYFVLSMAEVCAVPVGLSMLGRCLPKGNTGLASALWFATLALSQLVAGRLGSLWERWPHHSFFLLLLGSMLASSIAWCALSRSWLHRQAQRTGATPHLAAFAPLSNCESEACHDPA